MSGMIDNCGLTTYHAAPRGNGYKYFENLYVLPARCASKGRCMIVHRSIASPRGSVPDHRKTLPSLARRAGIFLQLPTLINHHLGAGRATAAAEGFHLLHHIHAFDDGAEDDVFAIEPFGLGGAEEEL